MVTSACEQTPQIRLSRVLKALGVARSVWYARRKSEPRRPGRKRRAVPEALAEKVRAVACEFPAQYPGLRGRRRAHGVRHYVNSASPAVAPRNPASRPGFRPTMRMTRALWCPDSRFARANGQAGRCTLPLRARDRPS